ncbi:MAG TPA: penicillin-binding protein 2 [Candidatus Paceibacterota bacterium]|nr:penicillin-binding protein 2 [Candidatus Paceibacterota bacterium]
MQDAKIHRRRIRIMMGLIIFLGLFVVGRLFLLQIVNQKSFKERAERQYLTPASESFDRGTIYFSKKDGTTMAAATVSSGFKVAIEPAKLKDLEKTYEVLNAVVPIEKESFISKANKKADPYEEVALKLNQEQADQILKEKLPGASLYRQKWRFYPGGELASKAIGFVSYKENELLGRYGLERYYNDVLSRGENNFYVNFFAEIFTNIQSTLFKNKTATGDIVTTIEPTVQSQLENLIYDIDQKWGSDAVGGLIMDPSTGEIIAMAHVPTFDLNEYGKETNVSVYSNPFSQDVYEMGSIVKPLVMAGAIDAKVVTPQTTYVDNTGFTKVQDRTFYNFDKKGRGKATMQDVLNQSLNTGMIFVEQKMGKGTFRNYLLDRYKLGEKTGVDLPGEASGLVGGLKTQNDVNYAAASFGQGIATSPLAIVRAYASLANGGRMVTPHLAKEIKQENGLTKTLKFTVGEPILSTETTNTITNMLVTVVDKGYNRGLPHYSVAAKTGTAQMARPDGSGYYDDRNFHSLIGYFPAYQPRFVLYLFNNYPKGASFSSQTLADPFFEMVQFMTSYYELTPDR